MIDQQGWGGGSLTEIYFVKAKSKLLEQVASQLKATSFYLVHLC
jgi:hypothetical protein